MSHLERFLDGLEGDWDVSNGTLVCPCNHRIEDDGRCPNDHVSPLLEGGLI